MKLFLFILISKIWKVLRSSRINRWLNNGLDIKIGLFLDWLDPRFIVMIGLTYLCQCNCIHCGMAIYKKDRENELTTNEWLELIDSLSLKKVKQVYFFGGEPLLRDDIFELINCAQKRGFITILDTNSYLLTKEMARKLKRAGLRHAGISIDSFDPKTHDALRGQDGLFERAIEGIKNCLNEKIICYISTYATKQNIKNGDLKKIIILGEKLGVDYIRILPPLMMGNWRDKKEIKLNKGEEKLLGGFRQFGFVYLEGNSCYIMKKHLFYISPYGDVQPCCYIPFSFGNIRKESLEKVLKRMWRHPMYKSKIKSCPVSNREFLEKYFSGINQADSLPINLYK